MTALHPARGDIVVASLALKRPPPPGGSSLSRRIRELHDQLTAEAQRLSRQLDRCAETVEATTRASRPATRARADASRLSAHIDERLAEAVMVALRRQVEPGHPRRAGTADGHLIIDPERLAAVVDGRRHPLTPTEWQLLGALLAASGRVLSRQELAARAWGAGYRSRGSEVEVYISRLRRKLGDARRGGMIETVRGRGYRFVDRPVDDPA